MAEKKAGTSRSRRRFLSGGASLLAGGIAGGVAYATGASVNQPTRAASSELPWVWRPIDPMEAGSRAYHYYLDVGG